MSLKVESPTRRLQRSKKSEEFGDKERQRSTRASYSEHALLLQEILENTFNSLKRFNLSDKERVRAAQDAVFLWTQAKLGQEAGARDGNNKISGFNLGAAVGFHYQTSPEGPTQFAFADGANRESDMIAIADVHTETSAIDRLKGKIDPLMIDHKGKFVDMIVITNAAPCASCRREIHAHATSGQSLIFVITDEGNASVNTISELFPTKFDAYDLSKVDPKLLKTAQITAQSAFPSHYQLPETLPLWGVVMESKDGEMFQGFYTGDDAFWSNSPTMNAISNLLQWGINHFPKKKEEESDQEYKERIRNQSVGQIKRVVIHYEGNLPEVYPS